MALRKLQLDGIPEVDDGLVATAARGPALRELAVRLCPGVGDASLAALAAQRPELEALAIDECSKVGVMAGGLCSVVLYVTCSLACGLTVTPCLLLMQQADDGALCVGVQCQQAAALGAGSACSISQQHVSTDQHLPLAPPTPPPPRRSPTPACVRWPRAARRCAASQRGTAAACLTRRWRRWLLGGS